MSYSFDPLLDVAFDARDLDVIGVVLVDGHRGGEIGLADLLHLDLPAFAQDDPRGLGLAGELATSFTVAPARTETFGVLHRFRREAGVGGSSASDRCV